MWNNYDINEDITEKVANEISLHEAVEIDDFITTLKSLKKIGYEAIELEVIGGYNDCCCGGDDAELAIRGFRNETPDEKKKRIAKEKKEKEAEKKKKEKEALKKEQEEKALYLKLHKKYGK